MDRAMINPPTAWYGSARSAGAEEGEVSLSSIPRPRLGPRLRRWLGVALILQCSLSVLVLVGLQSSWRTRARWSSLPTTAALLRDRLEGQVLHPSNPLAGKSIDSIVSVDGVQFAVVVDSQDRVVLTAGDRQAMPAALRVDPGSTLLSSPGSDGLQTVKSFTGASVVVTPLEGNSHRLLLGRSEERRVGKECRSRWSP